MKTVLFTQESHLHIVACIESSMDFQMTMAFKPTDAHMITTTFISHGQEKGTAVKATWHVNWAQVCAVSGYWYWFTMCTSATFYVHLGNKDSAVWCIADTSDHLRFHQMPIAKCLKIYLYTAIAVTLDLKAVTNLWPWCHWCSSIGRDFLHATLMIKKSIIRFRFKVQTRRGYLMRWEIHTRTAAKQIYKSATLYDCWQ